MTQSEWEYIYANRPRATKLRSLATVAGVPGCIFLPDNWTLPTGLSFQPNVRTDYETNDYTLQEWRMMETEGAVFLPASKYRSGKVVKDCASGSIGGHYMVSTRSAGQDYHHVFRFHDSSLPTNVGDMVKYYAIGVRLVTEPVYDTICYQPTYSLGDIEWALPPFLLTEGRSETAYTLEYRDPRTATCVTVHLLIRFPTGSVTTATIHDGENYEWHGKTYNQSAYVADTLLNAAGCDSICRLYLVVLPQRVDTMLALDATAWPADIRVEQTGKTGYPSILADSVQAGRKHFSVAADKTVYFSPGNLQYRASTDTWRFAEQQYHSIGDANKNVSSTYNGWIDLFGWGTSGWGGGVNAYQPWSTSMVNQDYQPGGDADADLTGIYAKADWGVYNAIVDGNQTDVAGTWRLPTDAEWAHLFMERENATNLFGTAVVNGVRGVMVLPDEFVLPSGLSFVSAHAEGMVWNSTLIRYVGTNLYVHNVYDLNQWKLMETAGAIFLPVVGYRNARQINSSTTMGSYWSSTHNQKNTAYRLHFNPTQVVPEYNITVPYALGVRLVHDCVYDTICYQPSYSFGPYAWNLPPVDNPLNHPDVQYTLESPIQEGAARIKVQLLIRFPSDSIEIASICEGESYRWHGRTYTAAIDTMDTLVNAAGCDSICSLHLTVLQHTDSVETASICQGEQYIWHGRAYTATIDTIDTLLNAVGCDSVCTLHLTVLQHTDSVEEATICQGEQYLWHGRTYTQTIDTTEILVNEVGCDSVCTLRLTVLEHSDSVEVATICQGDSYTWHGQTYSAETHVTDTLVNAVGCDSICTLHLTILEHSDSVEVAAICQGDSYTWHGQTYSAETHVTDTLVNAVGCDSICTLHLSILQHSDSMEVATICQGESYNWHGRSYSAETHVTDTLVNAVGCDSVCTLHLTILQHSDSVEEVSICQGETYIWHGRIYTQSIDTTEILVNGVGCDSVCTLHLTVIPTKRVTFTETITEGITYLWNGYEYSEEGTYTQLFSSWEGCDSIVVLELHVKPLVYEIITPPACAGERFVDFEVEAEEGLIDQLRFEFSPKAHQQYFRDTIVSLSSPDIRIPSTARAGVYEVEISPIVQNTILETRKCRFEVRYPSSVFDQPWDDFIAVLTHDYNGGYDFVAFSWYKDGMPLEGETHSYLHQPLEMGSAYSALLTAKDGTQLMSCEWIATHQAEVALYPLMVRPRENLHLHTSEALTLYVYSSAGALLYQADFQAGDQTFAAPPVAGVYIVKLYVAGEAGKTETKKLIVR